MIRALIAIGVVFVLFGVFITASGETRDVAYGFVIVCVGCCVVALAASEWGDKQTRDAHDRLAAGLREEGERRRRAGRPHQ